MNTELCPACDKPILPGAKAEIFDAVVCRCGASKPVSVAHRSRNRTSVSEHDIQCEFIAMVRARRDKFPCLYLVFAIPNAGAGASRGQAGKMKAEGVEPGVADIFVSVPSCTHHGLYLEFKRPGQKQRQAQFEFMHRVRAQDYLYEVVTCAEGAWNLMRDHLWPGIKLPLWDGMEQSWL